MDWLDSPAATRALVSFPVAIGGALLVSWLGHWDMASQVLMALGIWQAAQLVARLLSRCFPAAFGDTALADGAQARPEPVSRR